MNIGFQVLTGRTVFIRSRHFNGGKSLLQAKIIDIDSVGRGLWLETQYTAETLANNGVDVADGSKPPLLFLPFSEIDYVISFPLL